MAVIRGRQSQYLDIYQAGSSASTAVHTAGLPEAVMRPMSVRSLPVSSSIPEEYISTSPPSLLHLLLVTGDYLQASWLFKLLVGLSEQVVAIHCIICHDILHPVNVTSQCHVCSISDIDRPVNVIYAASVRLTTSQCHGCCTREIDHQSMSHMQHP